MAETPVLQEPSEWITELLVDQERKVDEKIVPLEARVTALEQQGPPGLSGEALAAAVQAELQAQLGLVIFRWAVTSDSKRQRIGEILEEDEPPSPEQQ